jgi:glycosyltransferase involved in cell wall biosynthesis
VLLVHLPAGVEDEDARVDERRVVEVATSVVTPSAWCREWLLREYAVDPALVRVARPGVVAAAMAPGTGTGTSLLTVGSLAPVKGQDLLLLALDRLADVSWRWTCVGPDVDGRFAANLHFGARALRGSIDFTGPLGGADLEAAYAGADLLVVPSRHETYGMVVTEALARGLPVVAHDVGGLREALGATPSGALPGLLVRPGDPAALAAALRMWLSDGDLRATLRSRAVERREGLDGWSSAADRIAALVREVAA